MLQTERTALISSQLRLQKTSKAYSELADLFNDTLMPELSDLPESDRKKLACEMIRALTKVLE